MSRRTKSLDEPPTWKPTLTPPTEYIAGVDHLPSEFWPLRQSKVPPIPHLCGSPCLSPGSSCFPRRSWLKLFLLLFWVTNPAAKRRYRWQQRSACFKLGYKSIDQGQSIFGYFATGKQYHRQFRFHTFYFDRNIAAVHARHLVIEEHGVEVARGRKP